MAPVPHRCLIGQSCVVVWQLALASCALKLSQLESICKEFPKPEDWTKRGESLALMLGELRRRKRRENRKGPPKRHEFRARRAFFLSGLPPVAHLS